MRLRSFWIASVVLVAIVAGGVGIYIVHSRPSGTTAPRAVAAGNVTPQPAPTVGTQTTTTTSTSEVLAVTSTSPANGSTGASPTGAISVTFNLAVDAAALQGYFLIQPTTPGSFSQGASPQTVVFKPSAAFATSSTVSVVLRQGLTSQDGATLDQDYTFGFLTVVSSRDVVFQVANQMARIYSLASGRTATAQVSFGDQVPNDLSLKTYSAKSADLLAAQVHDANGTYLDQTIPTDSLQLLDQQAISNNSTVTINRPDGIYLMLAADAGGQYGAMWLVVSKYGVLLRQDDRKIIVAGENLATGDASTTFNIVFYNLTGSVQRVLDGSVTGTAEFAARYPTPIDIAVASAGGEDVIVPMAAPQSNADIKVMGDLSAQPQIFITTDRAGYLRGDTVKFGGIYRISNDQAYSVPSGATIVVWSGYGQAKLVKVAVPVAPDGTFSGSFVMPAGAFTSDGTDGEMTLYAGTTDTADISPFFTVVDAIAPHSPAARLTISFDKPAYVAGDSVTATVTGVDGTGKSLAAKTVSLTLYSNTVGGAPSELGSYTAPTTYGATIGNPGAPLALDATGTAKYVFKANAAGIAADQEISLAATYGAGTTEAFAARSAMVYQAQDEIYLLASRSYYQVGDTLLAPFVVENRAGQRVTGMPVAWELDDTTYNGTTTTTTVLASGTLASDSNGLGTVQTTYSGANNTQFLLRVKAKDAAGNIFQDARTISIVDDPSLFAGLGTADNLVELSVTTDKLGYSTGDVAHLTVVAPDTVNALLSLERGRVHTYKLVSLAKGSNAVDIPITADLEPGFVAVFSYFRTGTYSTEGLEIAVSTDDHSLNVTASADAASYKAGQTAHLTIKLADSTGAPVGGSLLVDGFDAAMSAYKLADEPSIAAAFLAPSARLTNGSSSLIGVGSYGGRCGGGGTGAQPAITDAGHSDAWVADLQVDATGQTIVDVPIGAGTVRLVIFASTPGTALGQTEIDLKVTA